MLHVFNVKTVVCYRSVLTAAHCVCHYDDTYPPHNSASFCTANNPMYLVAPDQHVPYPDKTFSIEELFNGHGQVQTTEFNVLSLRIGSKNKNEGARIEAEAAFVMYATAVLNGMGVPIKVILGSLPDIGLILSKENMFNYPNVVPICLPQRFIGALCPQF